MAKDALTIKVSIDGLQGTLRALRNLPKDASVEIREASLELSKKLARAAESAGKTEGKQAALVSTTVKAAKDRVPVVQAGGNKKLGRNRKPAFKLLFGSEFGATNLKQYKPHVGNGSYWFYRTIEKESVTIAKEWQNAADDIIRKFSD